MGHSTTPSSDQYALGVVLYQLATGHLPYEADTPMGLALKHATEPLPRPRAVNPKLPDAVEEVIIRALSKDANYRYPSVTAFSDAFEGALHTIYDPQTRRLKSGSIGPPPSVILEPVRNALTSLTMPVVRTFKRRRALPFVAGILLLLMPATAFAFTLISRSQPFAVAQVAEQAAGEIMLQETFIALEPEDANPSGAEGGEGVVETAVAATMAALQMRDGSPGSPVGVNPEETTPGALSTGTLGAFGSLPSPSSSSTSTEAASTIPTSSPAGGSPTPIPSASPSLTPSDPASVTETDEPQPTDTPPPSATPVPTATEPPIDPCLLISVGGFERDGKIASWTLHNDSGSPQTVDSLRLTWPLENQSLFKVHLSGSTIWVGDEPGSPTTISSWIGGESSRTFSGGQQLQFRFKSDAADGSYGLVVNFSGGCQISP